MSFYVAGAIVVGALVSANASQSAANTQAKGGQNALNMNWAMFNQMQAKLAPYDVAGKDALSKLTTEMGPGGSLSKPFNFDISQDPGYQFRLQQGQQGVQNSASAQGNQLSGQTLKALTQYAQNYASGEYNAAFNRDMATKQQTFNELMGVVNTGEAAAAGTATMGMNTAASNANLTTGIANAQAAGQVGTANAISGGMNNYLLSSMFKSPNNNPNNTGNPSGLGTLSSIYSGTPAQSAGQVP